MSEKEKERTKERECVPSPSCNLHHTIKKNKEKSELLFSELNYTLLYMNMWELRELLERLGAYGCPETHGLVYLVTHKDIHS